MLLTIFTRAGAGMSEAAGKEKYKNQLNKCLQKLLLNLDVYISNNTPKITFLLFWKTIRKKVFCKSEKGQQLQLIDLYYDNANVLNT